MSFQLPKTCGVNVNLNNFRGELQAQAMTVLNVNLGTPAGLQEIANSLEGKLTTLKDQVAAQLPEIPEEIKSLRGDLAALASMTAGSFASVQKMATIAADYVGLSDIQGFANININDLASSVFSIGGTFDPCSLTVPNINLTPDGLLQKLPSIQPDLGAITKMVPVALPDQTIVDNLGEAIKNNIPIVSSALESGASTLVSTATPIVAAAEEKIETTKQAIESNVSTAITGMGDMVKKLPSGEPVVETKDNFVERVKTNNLSLMDEEPALAPIPEPTAVYVPNPDYFILADGTKRYYKKIMKYDVADRREKLRLFTLDEPQLTRRQRLVKFNRLVNSGEIEVLKVES
jgi:hypothetical protein